MTVSRYIKRMYILAVIPAVMSVLLSCAGETPETNYSPRQIAEVIRASQQETADLRPLLPNDSYFEHYTAEIYRIEDGDIADGVIFYTEGMQADEIAVFILKDDADVDVAKNALVDYINSRIAAFTGYAPEQAAILENGTVEVQDRHIALIICRDTGAAKAAFKSCFGNSPPAVPARELWLQQETQDGNIGTLPPLVTPFTPSPPPVATQPPDTQTDPPPQSIENDVYDREAIIDAWNSGDYSGLSALNYDILSACIDVMDDVIKGDMDDYEKELAIHDWIIINVDYDADANSNSPNAKPDPNNDNPYGPLINGKAICTGYAYTFQLFMDLLGIECITVHGHAVTGGEHAWNMVVIEGKWYCVDTTWNDPTSQNGNVLTSANYRFFNVPTQVLLDVGHVWDFDSTPVATAPQLHR